MIESFDELPPAWDEDFLPKKSREIALNGAVYERFRLHFCRQHLPYFFSIGSLGEIHSCSFETVLEEQGIVSFGDSITSHKKARTDYLRAFRKFGCDVPKSRGASSALLQLLLIEWENEQQKQEVQRSRSSPLQTFAELLTELNLKKQKRRFEDIQGYCLEHQQLASAFVVEADPDLHHWLVCSLLQSVDGLLNVTIIPTTGDRLFRSFDEFWESVALELALEGDRSHDEILECLCDRLQTQSIVMVVNQVHQARRVLPAFRDEFWYPLINKLEQGKGARSCLSFGGGLKLLMVQPVGESFLSRYDWLMESRDDDWLEHPPNGCLRYPIKLKALVSITPSDVRTWLARETVQQFLKQQVENSTVEECYEKVSTLMSDPSCDPYSVLHDLCGEFQFKNGLEALETVWQTSEVVA